MSELENEAVELLTEIVKVINLRSYMEDKPLDEYDQLIIKYVKGFANNLTGDQHDSTK